MQDVFVPTQNRIVNLPLQGLNDDDCAYFLGSTHVVENLESIIDLVTDVPMPLKVKQGPPNEFRSELCTNNF